jgi:peptide/nickel transport system permease protein
MIGEKLPYTLELAVASILVAMMVTIILGSLAAMKRNTIVDKAICGMAAFFEAAPSFFLAILLIQWFGVKLKIFPVSGADTLLHLVLPAALMGFSISARTTMLLRNNMIAARHEVITLDSD